MSTAQKTNLEVQVLDELADGQWHPIYKIKKNIDTIGKNSTKVSKEALLPTLTKLADEGLLLQGSNESFRFKSDELRIWRDTSSTLNTQDKKYQPRWFGGILEDDGWLIADLKTYDLIHFRADSSLTKQEIMSLTGEKNSAVQIDEDGLFRVFTTNGPEVYDLIKDSQNIKPEWKVSGVRLEKDLKRRNLEELPKHFVSDLCEYYGVFAKVLLHSHMSSITKHLPEPDDIQQQIYIWILDAIQRYDASTSIPFGAYLATALKKWVFNLNRKSFGRSVADAELKHSRAIAEFKLKHNREPKPEELAEVLGTDVNTVKRDSMAINTVLNLRNTGTIYQEDNELPLPSDELVNDNIEAMINNTLLSASIVTGAANVSGTKGLTGLVGVFYENWGAEKRSKKISLWLKNPKTQDAVTEVLKEAHIILKEGNK